MLQIKKNSWHFRLWRFGRESANPKPKNLCKYFWHIALVKILLPLTLALLVLTGIGALIWVVWGHPVQSAAIVLASIATICFIIGLAKFLQVMQVKREEKQFAARFAPPQLKKEPGVIRSFLKARKQKMCPLIEVVDD